MRHLAQDSAFTVLIESRQQAPAAGRHPLLGVGPRRAFFKAGAALLMAAAVLAAVQPLRAQARTHNFATNAASPGDASATTDPNVNLPRMGNGGLLKASVASSS